MIPEEIRKYNLGDRVDVSGDRGTIMYIGNVYNTEGVWLGIDWDNPERGKHDGSFMGVRYFTSSYPTSGSFVRPKNVNLGISIVEAIRNRYGDFEDAGLDLNVMSDCQHEMRAKIFEVVGATKVIKHISNFNNLETVDLHAMLINGAGPPNALSDMCSNIKELHLEKNLFSNWQSISEVVSQLNRISLINLSSNRLKLTENLNPEHFSSLRCVILGKMNYTWDDILNCFEHILNVEIVQVSFNRITIIKEPPKHIFTRLSVLDLQGNKLESWVEVNKLGKIETLHSLNLRLCELKDVCFPDCESSEESTFLFANLKFLVLSQNLYNNWTCISELDKLQSLADLRLTGNPLLEKETVETNRQLIIARIDKLQSLNGAPILHPERRGAELDYLKRYGEKWLAIKNDEDRNAFLKEHPCYTRLVDKHGPPLAEELKNSRSSLKNQLIQIELFSPDLPNVSFVKKVPGTMHVEKLIGLAQRLFNITHKIPHLSCVHAQDSHTKEFPLDRDLKQLDFYSIQNGDRILVRW